MLVFVSLKLHTHKKILVNQNGLLIVCVTFALWLKNLEKFTTRMARLFELESELTCKVFTSLSITNTIHIVLFTDQYGDMNYWLGPGLYSKYN